MRSLGFERNIADPSIHSLVWKDGTTGQTRELHVGSYVDDLTIISSDPKALAWLDAKLSARFPMQAAEARNLDAERGEPSTSRSGRVSFARTVAHSRKALHLRLP